MPRVPGAAGRCVSAVTTRVTTPLCPTPGAALWVTRRALMQTHWAMATVGELSSGPTILPGFLEASRAKAPAKTVQVVLQKFPEKFYFVLTVWRICAGRAEWEPYCLILRILLSRSEEHTSELQSRGQLVCRLL